MYLRVECKTLDAVPVVEVIGSVMFTARRHLESVGVRATGLLQSPDIGGCISGSKEWIFARGLMASSPSGVAKYVHIGAPVCQPC